MASPKEYRLSAFAPLIPLDSRTTSTAEDATEAQLLSELEQTLAAQQLMNQHLQQQQDQVDRLQELNHHVVARLEDALAENVETEKLRAKQSTMKAVAAGSVAGGAAGLTGIMAGPVAVATVPLGAGIGAGLGWGIGSLFTGATAAAVEKEHSRYLERHRKPQQEGRKEKEEDELEDQGDGKKEKVKKRRSQGAQGWGGDLVGESADSRREVKGHQQPPGGVIVSFRCWENQRYANRLWDYGNLTTGERGRWWVEKEADDGGKGGGGSDSGSPAVIHPEPMLEPEYAVTWVHDWVAEDALDSEGKPKDHGKVGPEEGWLYAADWRGPWTPFSRWNSYVRKRRWLRVGVPLPDEPDHPKSQGSHAKAAGHFAVSSFASDRDELLSSSSSSSSNQSRSLGESTDPNERFLRKLRDIKEALGEGSQLLYLQGEQLRDAEKQTHHQADILKTTEKVQGMSSFHKVILSYLTPTNWFAQKPQETKEAKGSGIRTWENDGWEFEGREATVTEKMMLETHELSMGSQYVSKELDLQAASLDVIGTNQDKSSAKVQKLTKRIEKQL